MDTASKELLAPYQQMPIFILFHFKYFQTQILNKINQFNDWNFNQIFQKKKYEIITRYYRNISTICQLSLSENAAHIRYARPFLK